MSGKTVRLPKYASPLMERGKFWSEDQQDGINCVEALAAHYGVIGPNHNNALAPPSMFFDPSRTVEERLEQWRLLAFKLAMDLVPAFRTKAKSGAPPRRPRESASFPHAHAARLVQIVDALQSRLRTGGLPSRRTDAFKELSKLLQKSPSPKWRFGALRKTSAFEQAWKSIPKDVKNNPASYDPTRPFNALHHGGLFGFGSWLVDEERKGLISVLPLSPNR